MAGLVQSGDGSASYVTFADQTLDDVVFDVFGAQGASRLGDVIRANGPLLALGIHLPEGTTLSVPPLIDVPPTIPTINLWD